MSFRTPGGDEIPYSDIERGDVVWIMWRSVGGKGGRARGKVEQVRRGGVEDPNGLEQFTIRADQETKYRVYPDAGTYDGGRTVPPVERIDEDANEEGATVTGVGGLIGVWET